MCILHCKVLTDFVFDIVASVLLFGAIDLCVYVFHVPSSPLQVVLLLWFPMTVFYLQVFSVMLFSHTTCHSVFYPHHHPEQEPYLLLLRMNS